MRPGLAPLALVGFLGFLVFSGGPKRSTGTPRRRKRPRVKVEIGEAVIEDSQPVDRLLFAAESERQFWGGKPDTDPETWPLLDRYWQRVGVDGRAEGLPWSGAFIAYVANEANPGSLPNLARHSAYARQALGERRPGHFRTLPPSEPVQLGDIIVKPRKGGPETWETLNAEPFVPFDGHGDIVTDIGPQAVTAIGGNKIGHTVATELYPRSRDGSIPGLVAVLRMNPPAQAAA